MDEDAFSHEFKPVYDKRAHPKRKPPESASAAASDTAKDPPDTYATPWEHLSVMDVRRINGHWRKLENKICIYCGGHIDSVKLKERVCPGPFSCQALANNGVKLIKVSKKIAKPPNPPAGTTASVVPPGVPTIQEEDDGGVKTPAGQTAAVVDTSNINSGDDYC